MLPIDQIGMRKYSTTVHMSSPIIAACYTPPIQSQNFGNINSLPKDPKSTGGQADPSRAEFKEKHVAQVDKIKPKLTGNSVNGFTTPTVEELPAEYQHAYEAHKKRHGEEYLQEYVKSLLPFSNHDGSSMMLRQAKKEDLQENQQERVHSANTVDSIETESNMTKSSTAELNGSFSDKTMVDSIETKLTTETFKSECVASSQPSASC